jgi:hypothetical protein
MLTSVVDILQGSILYIVVSLRWRMPFTWYAARLRGGARITQWDYKYGITRDKGGHTRNQRVLNEADQAFSPPYDLATRPLLPLSPVSKLSLLLSLPVCHRSSLPTGGGEVGWGAISYDGEKARPSINHSIMNSLSRSIKRTRILWFKWISDSLLSRVPL